MGKEIIPHPEFFFEYEATFEHVAAVVLEKRTKEAEELTGKVMLFRRPSRDVLLTHSTDPVYKRDEDLGKGSTRRPREEVSALRPRHMDGL